LRLETELSLLHELVHPNIMPLHEVLRVRGSSTVYLVTDFADCGSLDSVLQLHDLPLSTLQYIFREIVKGVAFLHSHRIVHQDIKPGNVLLSKGGRVLLSDFGMSHSFDTGASVFGTPLYQAPEVLDPAEIPACERGKEDIWALGITLFEMLFGAPPFKGQDLYGIVAAIRKTRLAPPRECDQGIWRLIGSMLAVDPRERCGIEEVMESDFVKNAPESADFAELNETVIGEVDPCAPVVEVEALVCQPGAPLEFLDKALGTARSHSYPD
jgi:serine/threonine protein kinase